MDGFRRAPRPQTQSPESITPPAMRSPGWARPQPEQPNPAIAPQPIESASKPPKKPFYKRKWVLFTSAALFFVIVLIVAGSFYWYNTSLAPVSKNKAELVRVVIEEGTSPAAIGETLEKDGVIRSQSAFSIYTRITRTQNKLQAGVYRLSPADSVPTIVNHLTDGNVDTFNITFLPGATLAQNKKVFLKAGFSEQAIDAAFAKSYDSPLFDSKPADADLEGYIYGETYTFPSNATVESVLTETFAQYEKVIADNDLVAKFKSHGLSLYQGITLASIVQREASGGDEAQIAQVFYTRLAADMPLGSDVTYQYIADKTGVARDPNLDSPYNTRKYTGLPPGPISVPGLAALNAVANPAAGDYVYFLSGDDDVTYFAHTQAEHEANIAAHCKVKCSIL